jgi:hypothetical protein
MPTEFQSLQAAISGNATFGTIAGTLAGSNSASIIPGQAEATLNSQLSATLNGLEAASKLRDNAFISTMQTGFLQDAMVSTEADANDSTIKRDNAMRQFEINEWTTSNRQESIFVYQFIFFGILIATIIGGFWRIGVITGPLASFLTFIDMAIVVFVIVYRAQYTTFKRDKRHWNKRRFQSAGPLFNAPNCPAAVDFVTNLPGNLEAGANSAAVGALGALSSALSGIGSAATAAGTRYGSYQF